MRASGFVLFLGLVALCVAAEKKEETDREKEIKAAGPAIGIGEWLCFSRTCFTDGACERTCAQRVCVDCPGAVFHVSGFAGIRALSSHSRQPCCRVLCCAWPASWLRECAFTRFERSGSCGRVPLRVCFLSFLLS
jgi:hypothetical protein